MTNLDQKIQLKTIGLKIITQKIPRKNAAREIGIKIRHKERPLALIIVISLLEEKIKNVIIAEIKTRELTTSFRKSGICRNAMNAACTKEILFSCALSDISRKLTKKINKENPIKICKNLDPNPYKKWDLDPNFTRFQWQVLDQP